MPAIELPAIVAGLSLADGTSFLEPRSTVTKRRF
jgi:hypothetical protein